MSTRFLQACLITCLTVTGATAQVYSLEQTFKLNGSGGWDYLALNPVNSNLYVSHSGRVNIINRNTGDSTGVITNTEGVHGIAFAPKYGKGFTSNGKINSLFVFDLKTNNVLGGIATGQNPDAIMYDPFSDRIYVCNGRSRDLTIINPANNEVVKTLPLGGKPETAVSDEAGNIYINIEDKHEIAVVSTKTLEVTKRWKTGNGKEPSGLAIDIKNKRLFAGCGNKLLVVLNAETGNVVKELPIGDGCDGVAFDNVSKTIFSSNGEGTLTVIKEKSANEFVVVQNAVTQKGARTLAVDEKTHKVYLPTADYSETVKPGQKRPDVIPGTFRIMVMSAGK
jgi:YVTN family beta-propeller protein